MTNPLAQRLRRQCEVLRYRPIPLNHLIPMLQEAADALDALAPTPVAPQVPAMDPLRLRELEQIERDKFEAWFSRECTFPLTRSRAGGYESPAAYWAWRVWQHKGGK